jgi:hypothetical protein
MVFSSKHGPLLLHAGAPASHSSTSEGGAEGHAAAKLGQLMRLVLKSGVQLRLVLKSGVQLRLVLKSGVMFALEPLVANLYLGVWLQWCRSW